MTKRFVVTGRAGQVVSALVERAGMRDDVTVVTLGRPTVDLADPEAFAAALAAAMPDVIVSAAAYTAVDQAESDEATAFAVNANAPGAIGRAAAVLGVPVVHLSTDYVFDGSKATPYDEDDAVAPLGVYGRSKLDGELKLALATPNHAILRTAWVYSAYGRNFLKTMLKLAETRASVGVVADQIGNPTSAHDIADGILAVGLHLSASDDAALRGVFHMTASGEASWAAFAEEIFRQSRRFGGPHAAVERLATSAYPTPARRPANSRLDSRRIAALHGVTLPDWRAATAAVVGRLVAGDISDSRHERSVDTPRSPIS